VLSASTRANRFWSLCWICRQIKMEAGEAFRRARGTESISKAFAANKMTLSAAGNDLSRRFAGPAKSGDTDRVLPGSNSPQEVGDGFAEDEKFVPARVAACNLHGNPGRRFMKEGRPVSPKVLYPTDTVSSAHHCLLQCPLGVHLFAPRLEDVACKPDHKGEEHFIGRASSIEKCIDAGYESESNRLILQNESCWRPSCDAFVHLLRSLCNLCVQGADVLVKSFDGDLNRANFRN
jgi:hypothetical protein